MSAAKKYDIYEVQKYGRTIEWDFSFKKAEEAFKECVPGGVKMYRLSQITGTKAVIQQK